MTTSSKRIQQTPTGNRCRTAHSGEDDLHQVCFLEQFFFLPTASSTVALHLTFCSIARDKSPDFAQIDDVFFFGCAIAAQSPKTPSRVGLQCTFLSLTSLSHHNFLRAKPCTRSTAFFQMDNAKPTAQSLHNLGKLLEASASQRGSGKQLPPWTKSNTQSLSGPIPFLREKHHVSFNCRVVRSFAGEGGPNDTDHQVSTACQVGSQ